MTGALIHINHWPGFRSHLVRHGAERLDAYTVPCTHAGSGGRRSLRPVVRDVRRNSRGYAALKIVMRADKDDRVAAA
jgi:hypothetical protein